MESSSTSTRFRFRDHQEMGDTAQSDASSDVSSVSSDSDGEVELESMTGKGIKHLCSELLELKAESDEEFHRNIFSNYSAFIRVFEEVKDMENELVQLKSQLIAQKSLVKDLTDGVYLKFLSEETIESIIQESECAEPTQPIELEDQIDRFSETLDALLLENRIDEAIAVLEMEDENFQKMQFESSSPGELLQFYSSAIYGKRDTIALHLTLAAENPRMPAAELQKALAGICRLGGSHLVIQLLLKYYHSRLAAGIENLKSSKSCSHGLYVKELAKFVFSMISQAARGFVMLYGETSPYASELIQWAREETKAFVASFNRYVKSISEINGGLSAAVEAMHFAITYCSLLENQRLVLRPWLIKHIRPCMEEVLQIHVDHFKKVIAIFTTTDTWVLGRYLVSGILNGGASSMDVGQQPEYCLLTNSGRKLITLLQAIIVDVAPLLSVQLEASILIGFLDLFTEYIAILEKAITSEARISERGSRINSAVSLRQQLSVLANLSTLEHLFSNMIRSFFSGTSNMDSKLMKNRSAIFQQKELAGSIMFIQEAAARIRDHFRQKFINRMVSFENVSVLVQETNGNNTSVSSALTEGMPSIAFQVLFLELRKLDRLAEDNVYEEHWLMELLRELIEAIFVWITNERQIWVTTEENSPVQLSDIFTQFLLDMHFLEEIVRRGGYFSENPLVLETLMESAFTSAGLDPERYIEDDGWVKTAATETIENLLAIEKMRLLSNEESVDSMGEEGGKTQFEYENEPAKDGSRGSTMEYLSPEEDPLTTDTDEVAITSETVEAEFSSPGKLCSLDGEGYSVDLADNSGGQVDVESRNASGEAEDGFNFADKLI